MTKVAWRHRTDVLMQIDSEQDRLLARLQMRTQAAIDAAHRRRGVHGTARRDLVRATLVKSLAQNGVTFQDDRLDHITDAIMTGRRVDASTVVMRADAKRSGARK